VITHKESWQHIFNDSRLLRFKCTPIFFLRRDYYNFATLVFYGVRGPRAVRARIPSWFTANYRPARISLRLPGENRPVNDLPAAGDALFR